MEEEVEKDYHEGHEPQLGYDHFEDEYEQRHDPEHPYCTNWPVNKKKGENEKIQRNEQETI